MFVQTTLIMLIPYWQQDWEENQQHFQYVYIIIKKSCMPVFINPQLNNVKYSIIIE